jgi:hypothetical protein
MIEVRGLTKRYGDVLAARRRLPTCRAPVVFDRGVPHTEHLNDPVFAPMAAHTRSQIPEVKTERRRWRMWSASVR